MIIILVINKKTSKKTNRIETYITKQTISFHVTCSSHLIQSREIVTTPYCARDYGSIIIIDFYSYTCQADTHKRKYQHNRTETIYIYIKLKIIER